jgi:hypothetical protein
MGGIDYFWGNKMKSDENVQGVISYFTANLLNDKMNIVFLQ